MAWQFIMVNGPYGGTCEGPAWDGTSLLFTHIPKSHILRYDPNTRSSNIYKDNTGNANGLMFDSDGRLYACEGGARRVVRYESDGTTTVLSDSFEGKKLNMPNDLAIDKDGRIWFTDPFYEGAGGPETEDRSLMELDHESVYYIESNKDGTWSTSRASFDTTKPNGILFSLDYETLYVAQTNPEPGEKRELRSYPINNDGTLGPYSVLHDFGDYRGIDGMVLDSDGNIVATAGYREGGPGPLIYVFSPSGEVLETHGVPEDRPTNCSFGGPDLSTLFVTTGGGHVFQASTDHRGRLHYPKLAQ